MNKKDLINEIAGVPKAIDSWVNILVPVVIDLIKSVADDGWETEANGTILNKSNGEEEDITVYKTVTTFNQKYTMNLISNDDPTSFIDSKTYRQLPIWYPTITIDLLGVPNVALAMQESISASVNVPHGEISDIDGNEAIENIELTFKPMVPMNVDKTGLSPELIETLTYGLKSSVSHELLHVYQKYMQMKSGKPSHFGQETMLNVMVNNEDEYFKEWNAFLHLIYLHLSFEVNARVTQTYYELKDRGITTSEGFLDELKKTTSWRMIEQLEEFDTDTFMKNFDKGDFNPMELIHKAHRGLSLFDNEKNLKKLISDWNTMLQQGVEAVKDMGLDIPMDKVPQKAIEDPYYFFKFFEKRFHKNAKQFKRKLFKLASIVIEDKEPTNKNNRVYNKDSFDDMVKEGVDDLGWMDDVSSEWVPSPGDKFTCKPGWSRNIGSGFSGEINDPNCAGSGYKVDRVFTVESLENYGGEPKIFTSEEIDRSTYLIWPKGMDNGIYSDACTPMVNESDDLGWMDDVTSDMGFNIEDFYGTPFYEIGDDGTPLTYRGIPSEFTLKDMNDSTVVHVCYMEREGEECATYGKGSIQKMFSRGQFIFVHEYVEPTLDINESDDDLDWMRDAQSFDPRGKKILIDFVNDPKWEGQMSYGGRNMYKDVANKLLELGYDAGFLSTTRQNVGYIFLDEYKYANSGQWIVGWNDVDSDNDLSDIDEFEVMLATEFLNQF